MSDLTSIQSVPASTMTTRGQELGESNIVSKNFVLPIVAARTTPPANSMHLAERDATMCL